jgi:hypothetical protein
MLVISSMKRLARRVARFAFASSLAVTLACSQASSGDSKAATAGGAPPRATGTVAHKGVTMPATSSVAVWDAEGATLRVYFLASAPTAAEIAGLQRGYWQILLDKPGPDLQKWPKAQPNALVQLSWREKKDKVGQLDQARIILQVWGIPAENENAAFVFSEGETHGLTLTGPFKDGGPITLVAKYAQDDVAWDVQTTAKVLPGL